MLPAAIDSFRGRCALAAATLAAAVTNSARADIDLVVNGEMETPVIAGFSIQPNANVPGWSNTGGTLELWEEQFSGSPQLGTDGDPTGQHLELTTSSGAEVVTQAVVVPACAVGDATFSFDGWRRDGTHVNFSIDGTQSGLILAGSLDVSSADQWFGYVNAATVIAGETVTLSFWSTGAPGNGDGGTHIDQVVFSVATTGACCYQIEGTANFDCVQTTEVDCLANYFNSTYQGDCTDCVPGLCDPPTGACCAFLPPLCQVLTEDDCDTLNGVYFGDNTTCTSYTCVPCTEPPPGMVAWWPFDETAGLIAYDAVNNNDGVRAGTTPPVHGPGVVANALHFDGASSVVLVPDDPTLNFGVGGANGQGDFSIDAWINLDQFAVEHAPIVHKRDPSTGIGYYFFLLDGNLALILEDGVGPAGWAHCHCCSGCSPLVPINQDVHVAVTVDRDDPAGVVFYLNGAPVGDTGDPTQWTSSLVNPVSLRVGDAPYKYFPGDGPAFTDGLIDELEIFDRALDAAEVAAIYDAGPDGKCKATCWAPWDWPFCENENVVTVSTSVCNWSSVTQSFLVAFSPLPVGPGCTIPGPTTFNILGPNPVTVPANTCVTVQVQITRPINMNAVNDIGCYLMSITNQGNGHEFVCHGSVVDRRDLCGVYDPGPSGGILIGVPGVGTVVDFDLTLPDTGGAPVNVPWSIEPLANDMQPSGYVSLDGLPPGKPETGSTVIGSGQTETVTVGVEFLAHNPFNIHDLVLSTDIDGDGAYEPLISVGLRSVRPPPCPADLDGNGSVGTSDLLILLAAWGPCGAGSCPGDVNGDLVVGTADLLALLAAWGPCVTP